MCQGLSFVMCEKSKEENEREAVNPLSPNRSLKESSHQVIRLNKVQVNG